MKFLNGVQNPSSIQRSKKKKKFKVCNLNIKT